MSNYFRLYRNIELSVIYYLETEFANNWSGVNVVKSFSKAYEKSLPVVCIRLGDISSFRKEIGSNSLREQPMLIIDIFANSDGQRLDLAAFIVDKLKSGFTYYEHAKDPSNPKQLTRTANGKVRVVNFISNRRLDFGENVDKHDKYRHIVVVTLEKL